MVQTVRLTMDIHQLLNAVIDVPVAQVVQGFLVSDSLLYGVRCSPVEYQTADFPGSLLQEIFTYSALSGLTVDTCSLQSTRPLGRISHVSYVEGGSPAVLESCSSSNFRQVLHAGCVQRQVVDDPVRLSTWGPRQYLDKVVDMPVGVSGKLWFLRSCSSSTRSWRRGLMSCGWIF